MNSEVGPAIVITIVIMVLAAKNINAKYLLPNVQHADRDRPLDLCYEVCNVDGDSHDGQRMPFFGGGNV